MKQLSEKEVLRKHAIGRAAAVLFDRKGYLETSLQDISKELGASKGAIYYYFSSKHEILFFILDTYMDSLLRGLEEDLRRERPGVRRVELLIRRHMSKYNNRVPEAKALLLDAHNLPAKDFRIIAAKERKYAGILAGALAEHFGGKAPKVQLKALAYVLFGMCNSVMHWHDPNGPIKLDELTDLCLNVFLRGVASLGAGAGERRKAGGT